jgi:hypothetical protein
MWKVRYICVSVLFFFLAGVYMPPNLALADKSRELEQVKKELEKAQKAYDEAYKKYEECQKGETDYKTLEKLRKEALRSFEQERSLEKSRIRSVFMNTLSSGESPYVRSAITRIGTDIERAMDAYYNKLKSCISSIPPCPSVTHSFTLTISIPPHTEGGVNVPGFTQIAPCTIDSREMQHQELINQINSLVRKEPLLKRGKPNCEVLKVKADAKKKEVERLEQRVKELERVVKKGEKKRQQPEPVLPPGKAPGGISRLDPERREILEKGLKRDEESKNECIKLDGKRRQLVMLENLKLTLTQREMETGVYKETVQKIRRLQKEIRALESQHPECAKGDLRIHKLIGPSYYDPGSGQFKTGKEGLINTQTPDGTRYDIGEDSQGSIRHKEVKTDVGLERGTFHGDDSYRGSFDLIRMSAGDREVYKGMVPGGQQKKGAQERQPPSDKPLGKRPEGTLGRLEGMTGREGADLEGPLEQKKRGSAGGFDEPGGFVLPEDYKGPTEMDLGGYRGKVTTPSGKVSQKDTEYVIWVSKEGETMVVVIKGSVELEDKAGEKRVQIQEGQMSTVKLNDVPQEPESVDLKKLRRWWE